MSDVDDASGKERRRKSDLEESRPLEADPIPLEEPAEVEPRDNQHVAVYRESFVGPLPPPSIMQAYEEIYPGAAAELFGNLREQSRHRREIERKVIESDIRAEWRGLHLGFVLALVIVIGGFALMFLDKDVYGLAAIVAAVMGLVSVFVYSKRRQAAELAEKTPPRLPGQTEPDEEGDE
jgi:uncharacterized membrane protein